MAHSEKMTQTQSLFKGRIIEVKKDKVLLENGKETTNEKHEKDILTDFRDLVNCSGAGSAYVETDDL